MNRTVWVLLVAAGCSTGVMAQDKKMETDRPSETQTPELTEKGYLQAETGFRKEQQDKDAYLLFHPTTILRWALSSRLELRSEITAETLKNKGMGKEEYGLMPVELGFKAKLLEEKGALPQTTFLAQVGVPAWASKDHRVPHVYPRLRLLFQNSLTDHIKLGYNLGAEWSGDETAPQWIYTFSPQFDVGDKWLVFIESYGNLQKGQAPQHVLDGGVAYYISNNVMLDVFGGAGLNHAAPDYFIASGISFRIKP